jgi:hypothetical protein
MGRRLTLLLSGAGVKHEVLLAGEAFVEAGMPRFHLYFSVAPGAGLYPLLH